MKERYKHKLKSYKMEIQDLNEEFENQRQSYHADLRDQQLQIDLLTGTNSNGPVRISLIAFKQYLIVSNQQYVVIAIIIIWIKSKMSLNTMANVGSCQSYES